MSAISSSKVAVRQSSRRSTRQKVLLVDDDSFVLRAQRRILGRYMSVETASNAELAAAKLSVQEYDAIITDFDMPNYNGVWLLMQAASRYPNMKRILVSANDPSLFAPHLSSGLIQYYHKKPICNDGLMESILV